MEYLRDLQMDDSPHIRLEMLSQARYLSGARTLVCAVAERYGFDSCAAGQIGLAVDEALANVIKHGYVQQPNGRIWMTIQPIQENDVVVGIKIVIEDMARQVDVSEIKPRNLNEIRPGGLGVHIIRELMDTATWEQREEGGMRLTMIKRKDGKSVPSCLPEGRKGGNDD